MNESLKIYLRKSPPMFERHHTGNSDTIAHPFSENIDHLNQNLMNIINKGLQGVKQDFFLVVNHDWK